MLSTCSLDALVAACEMATETEPERAAPEQEEYEEGTDDNTPASEKAMTCNLVTDTLPKYRRHKSKVSYTS